MMDESQYISLLLSSGILFKYYSVSPKILLFLFFLTRTVFRRASRRNRLLLEPDDFSQLFTILLILELLIHRGHIIA